jgi:prepilin peptidase CpaA
MLVTVLLLGLVSVAAVTDTLWHKIYNWTTYPGMLAALGFHGVGSLLVFMGRADTAALSHLGWISVGDSLLGLLLCGFVMIVCFVLFRIGGGDVKLIAMIGALVGYEQGLVAMLWTFVLGGCAGVIVLIWRVGWWRLLKRVLLQIVYSVRVRGWSALTPDERAELQPPLFLAPCSLAAVVIVRFGLERYLPLF